MSRQAEKKEIYDWIVMQSTPPASYSHLQQRLLVEGRPGQGKTMICKQLVDELSTFFGPDKVIRYINLQAYSLEEAKKLVAIEPDILFLDEMDCLPKRSVFLNSPIRILIGIANYIPRGIPFQRVVTFQPYSKEELLKIFNYEGLLSDPQRGLEQKWLGGCVANRGGDMRLMERQKRSNFAKRLEQYEMMIVSRKKNYLVRKVIGKNGQGVTFRTPEAPNDVTCKKECETILRSGSNVNLQTTLSALPLMQFLLLVLLQANPNQTISWMLKRIKEMEDISQMFAEYDIFAILDFLSDFVEVNKKEQDHKYLVRVTRADLEMACTKRQDASCIDHVWKKFYF